MTAASSELRLTPALTPRGRLTVVPQDDAPAIEPALAARIREAFDHGSGHGLLHLVEGDELLLIVSAAGPERVVAFLKNSHFATADGQLEGLLRETIDRLYASPEAHPASARLLAGFRRLLGRLFPAGRALANAERVALAEQSIKTVYLMQLMDAWTFDSVRLAKCSCQHLLPGGRRIPSCGYYSYHRRFDPRFA